MKKIVNILLIFITVSLVAMPSAEAWKWSTHSQIVGQTYYAMPQSIKSHLNLAEMREGSIYPDKLQDWNSQGYPLSYNKANTWLSKGKTAYNQHNYYYASFCFGVASHYISDSFSASHCVSIKPTYNHWKYELQAKYFKPKIHYMSGNLKTIMYNGYKQGKKDWNSWLTNNNPAIAQNDLNNGASASYTAIKRCISNS